MIQPQCYFRSVLLITGLIICSYGTKAFALAVQDSTRQNTSNQCVETEKILSYKVESDELIRLFLKNKTQKILRLKNHCPQLYFHRYISYTPVNGKLCAGSDQIKTRAGLACRIGSIKSVPATVNVPSKQEKTRKKLQ